MHQGESIVGKVAWNTFRVTAPYLVGRQKEVNAFDEIEQHWWPGSRMGWSIMEQTHKMKLPHMNSDHWYHMENDFSFHIPAKV